MTTQSIRNWWKRHADYPCFYCGIGLTLETRTRDHLIPTVKGGRDDSTNIVPACFTCNSDKGQLTWDEYLWILDYRHGRKNVSS